MELRKDARWALVVPTSIGVRITPENRQPVHTSTHFTMQATSAEANVASLSSLLGLPALLLTNFVEDSPISAFIKADLRSRGLSFRGPDKPQGDAWGHRPQFNIADSGYGGRAPRVWNDRAGEVGRHLDLADFDLDQLFDQEGAQVLHMSGLVAAISEGTAQFCVQIAQRARRSGTLVSFDLNYRESFWEGRQEELRQAFRAIAECCDILYGNEEDFQLCLGVEGPKTGDSLDEQAEGFQQMIGRIREEFPDATWIGTSLREVVSANEHRWGMVLWHGAKGTEGGFHVASPRTIQVLDRIGGGDASVGGVLYGLLKGWEAEKCLQFGWACGALAATSLTDHAAPADEEQVWSIWEGNARVQR